jgi:hypothetical protein
MKSVLEYILGAGFKLIIVGTCCYALHIKTQYYQRKLGFRFCVTCKLILAVLSVWSVREFVFWKMANV